MCYIHYSSLFFLSPTIWLLVFCFYNILLNLNNYKLSRLIYWFKTFIGDLFYCHFYRFVKNLLLAKHVQAGAAPQSPWACNYRVFCDFFVLKNSRRDLLISELNSTRKVSWDIVRFFLNVWSTRFLLLRRREAGITSSL